jgi:hypothetical protein
MTPRSSAIRRLMESPPVRSAPQVVRKWLGAILKSGGRSASAGTGKNGGGDRVKSPPPGHLFAKGDGDGR